MKMKYRISTLLFAACTLAATTSCSDDDYSVATGDIITTVQTGSAAVTATSATTTGTVLNLSSQSSSSYSVGVVYGTSSDPTTSGTKQSGSYDASTGAVSTTLADLTKGVTYYYATYVTLAGRVTKYGEVKSFITTDADIASADASGVTACSATLGGTVNVASDVIASGSTETTYGVKISTSADDVQNGLEYATSGSSQSFSVDIDGLLPGTTYYYTTFFSISDGYSYGDVKSFTTETMEMEYVDLGLSVLWAACNIGAESESEYGALIGWADVAGMKRSTYTTVYTPAENIVGTDNDIAYALSSAIDGSSIMKSMLPTKEQIEELIAGTTQTWEEVDGVGGYRFTSTTTGNSIFIPAAGYREGETVNDRGTMGDYWSGSINAINKEYGNTLTFNESSVSAGTALRYMGLAVRSVRKPASITPDASKVLFVNANGDGSTGRIEIYNEYGDTKNNPSIEPSNIGFSENMVVRFTISGINDNLVSNADNSYIAGLEFADADWKPGYWSPLTGTKYDDVITGDGSYTVWMETTTAAEGAVVFCVDIANLWAQLKDPSKVKVTVDAIYFDANVEQEVNADIVQFQNKDGNGTDGRIEIYNEYGNGGTVAQGYYNDKLNFNGPIIVNFTISGIDGNLSSSASKSYKTELTFADADWYPSYWGGASYGSTTVTGDGTYEVYALMSGYCSGAVVWTIELYNLWKDLLDTSKVSVTVNSVVTPGKN